MSGERGITIVEVLVAVIVLSIGLLGLASTAALTTRMIGDARHYTEASTLAARQSEILRSRPCASLTNGSQVGGGYSLTWNVTNPATQNPARHIDVTVTTALGRGRTRTYAFSTMIPC